MQSERTLGGFDRLSEATLAGLLIFLLMVAAALSVSHALHQSLHHDGAPDNHFCLVCSFAKGQLSAADVALASALVIFCCLCGIRAAKPAPLPATDYRLSPSRAPPRS